MGRTPGLEAVELVAGHAFARFRCERCAVEGVTLFHLLTCSPKLMAHAQTVLKGMGELGCSVVALHPCRASSGTGRTSAIQPGGEARE
jgi:hypothetical protein